VHPGEFKILAALMDESKGLTYTQLKRKIKLSNPVLSEYLASFVKEGMILKDPESKLYFIAYAYQPTENLGDPERDISTFIRNIPLEGSRIAQVEDQDLRKKIYADFLSFHMNNISVLLVMAMRKPLIQTLKGMKKEQDFRKKMQKLKKEDAEKFIEQWVETWQAALTQYYSMVQNNLVNWIIPYVQMLALAYIPNAQFTLADIDKKLPQMFSKEAVDKTFWFRQLEAIDEQLAH